MLQNSSNKTQQNSILKRKNTKNQILMEKSFFFILKTQNMLSKTVERCVIIGNFSDSNNLETVFEMFENK